MLQGRAGHNGSAGQRSSSVLTGIFPGLALLHAPRWCLTSGLELAGGEGRATVGPAAETDGQDWIHVLLKTSSCELCELFKKDPSLLKDHAGFSVVHEEGGTSCSFSPSLLSPLLLWRDEKSRWEAGRRVSVPWWCWVPGRAGGTAGGAHLESWVGAGPWLAA